MSDMLRKMTKLIPMLGTTNVNEKMVVVSRIEKLLENEKLTWTDVGLQLGAFLTDVLLVEDKVEATAAPQAPKTTGWATSTAAPPRPQPPPWRTTAQAGPASPQWSPPPQPKRVDPRTQSSSMTTRLDCIKDIKAVVPALPKADLDFLLSMEAIFHLGLKCSPKQQKRFEELSKLI